MSYSDSYLRQYERRETTVNTILDNLSKGGVQPDYASQWAAYYRSQGMSREADMIETYVRGLEAGRQSAAVALGASGGRADLPMGGGGGYGTPASCYRCDKSGHFARECPEFTGIKPSVTREIDSGPRNIPCRDGAGCKFVNLPGGCRYLHEGITPGGGGDRSTYSSSICYRCNGVGHFARDCPTFTGVRRDAAPSGGGPMRRVAHPTRDQPPGTSECYRCNKIGHFARECPEYTGTPYPNAYRGRVAPTGFARPGLSRPGEYGTSKCLKCNRYGHFARECREEENRCYKCSESGHIAKDCDKADVCYVCNKEGHLAKECPDGDQKTCYKCSGKGHIALSCPSVQQVTVRRSPVMKAKDVVDPIDESAGDQVLSAADLEDL